MPTRKEKRQRPVLVVGAPQNVADLLTAPNGYLRKNDGIVGALPLTQDIHHFLRGDRRVFPHNASFEAILHSQVIEEVVFSPDWDCLQTTNRMLKKCEEEGIPARVMLPFLKPSLARGRTELVDGLPVFSLQPAPRRRWQLAVKRIIDIVGAAIGLLILSPVFLVVAVLVKVTSKGPVLYRWQVLGLYKRPIVSYKFRTMVKDADALKKELLRHNEMAGAVFKMKNDPRITRLGKFLRKYSIDELPQLWSVLKGDLSLVGPRPPLQSEIRGFADWQRRKLSVKPGLTCLWQINGRNRINDFDHWVKLDLEYIDTWSLWLDVKILLKTIPAVLKGSGM